MLRTWARMTFINKKAGRSPPSQNQMIEDLRALASPRFRSLLRHHVLSALHLRQNRFRIVLEFMSFGSLVDELLQIICRVLILRFIAGTEERETDAKIGVRIVGLLSENLLKLND